MLIFVISLFFQIYQYQLHLLTYLYVYHEFININVLFFEFLNNLFVIFQFQLMFFKLIKVFFKIAFDCLLISFFDFLFTINNSYQEFFHLVFIFIQPSFLILIFVKFIIFFQDLCLEDIFILNNLQIIIVVVFSIKAFSFFIIILIWLEGFTIITVLLIYETFKVLCNAITIEVFQLDLLIGFIPVF